MMETSCAPTLAHPDKVVLVGLRTNVLILHNAFRKPPPTLCRRPPAFVQRKAPNVFGQMITCGNEYVGQEIWQSRMRKSSRLDFVQREQVFYSPLVETSLQRP